MNKSVCFCKLFLLSAVSTLFCGCALLSEPVQTETRYFDLKCPEQIASVPIDVREFTTMSGERFRMSVRKNETVILGSEFHKWVQTPGSLVTKYLRLAYRENTDDKVQKKHPVQLRGEVLLFETHGGFAELGIRYQLRLNEHKIGRTVLLKDKMEKTGPEAFADAMSKAVQRFARQIAAEAETLTERN